jgi:hypothetical protein
MSRKSLTPLNALSSAVAPTVPTLQSGDLYYDTSTGLQVYNGSAWVAVGSAGAVSQIIAGTNITISPTGGTGAVTINSSGGGGAFDDEGNILANQVFG